MSFERLADVIDTPEESDEVDKTKMMLPPLQGEVRFEDLSFRFRAGQPEVLKDINLEIKAGTFVGIVGQSGSGKSTLMKLLPRLYEPGEGRIPSTATTSARLSCTRFVVRSASCPRIRCCSAAPSARTSR